jgi:hypothetical protein
MDVLLYQFQFKVTQLQLEEVDQEKQILEVLVLLMEVVQMVSIQVFQQ